MVVQTEGVGRRYNLAWDRIIINARRMTTERRDRSAAGRVDER